MLAFDASTAEGTLEIVLFAKSTDHAASIFCEVHLKRFGVMPPKFSIERRTIRKEQDKKALRDVLRREIAGVGTASAGGWIVHPLGAIEP